MNTVTTLKELLANEEAEYEKLLKKIEPLLKEQKIYEDKISAFRKLISSYENPVLEEDKGKTGLRRVRVKVKGGTTTASAIRSIVGKYENDFTVNDVRPVFKENFPELNFSRYSFHNVMKERVESGESKVVEQGEGITPSRFRNIVQKELYNA